eukprot:tig00000849_g4766.t1
MFAVCLSPAALALGAVPIARASSKSVSAYNIKLAATPLRGARQSCSFSASSRRRFFGGVAISHCHKTAVIRTMSAVPAQASAASPSSEDILIVGAGVLGSRVGRIWAQRHASASVAAETRTTKSHSALSELGLKPRARESLSAEDAAKRFPYVIFCAPPSMAPEGEDYVKEAQRAASLWDGTGCLLFTSSSGVYPQEDGTYTEESATVDPKQVPRVAKLVGAEEAILAAGGCVVRLTGLYLPDRGAHSYWLKMGTVAQDGKGLISQIHYEDAAILSVAALESNARGRVFLGTDDVAMTREEIIAAAVESGLFPGQSCTFTGPQAPGRGRRFDNSRTRAELSWKPQWPSMAAFFRENRA